MMGDLAHITFTKHASWLAGWLSVVGLLRGMLACKGFWLVLVHLVRQRRGVQHELDDLTAQSPCEPGRGNLLLTWGTGCSVLCGCAVLCFVLWGGVLSCCGSACQPLCQVFLYITLLLAGFQKAARACNMGCGTQGHLVVAGQRLCPRRGCCLHQPHAAVRHTSCHTGPHRDGWGRCRWGGSPTPTHRYKLCSVV
jgi:hypothetical protein